MDNMPPSEIPCAVVLGLSPTGLHVVRELGRQGISVVGVAAQTQAGSFSRYLSAKITELSPERRLDMLCQMFPVLELSKGIWKPVLIPTSDQDVCLIIDNIERLSQHFSFQLSYSDGLASRIMDKERFYEMCASYGVEFPRIWKGTVSDMRGLRSELLFPCIIKPSRIHEIKEKMKGKKVWMVRDVSELDRVLESVPDDSIMLLAQEIVPGAETEISLYCGYFDVGCQPSQPFTARKLRQYPPGFGSASLVQSSDESDCRQITEKFLSSIGYRGIAASEFKRDPMTGKWKIIEINVRPSLWFSISSSAAKHPVLAAYYKLAGIDRVLPELPQRNGVRWRYLLKDMWSAIFYAGAKNFILPSPDINASGGSKKRVYAVFAMDDPMPALGEVLNFFAKAWIRIRR